MQGARLIVQSKSIRILSDACAIHTRDIMQSHRKFINRTLGKRMPIATCSKKNGLLIQIPSVGKRITMEFW
jgi:hypothetical protein